jgi:predicted aspartyl protease
MRLLWVVPAITGMLLIPLGAMALNTGPALGFPDLPDLPIPGLFHDPARERLADSTTPTREATITPAGDTSVPIRVVTTGKATLVLVPVKVNGRGPFDFVLDTGASTSTVDRTLVRRLRLPRTGETARVRGVTGEAVVPVVRLRAWTVGGQPLVGRSLTVTDLGDPTVFGLLGSDELRGFGRITVDYQRKRLVLRQSSKSRSGG